MADKFTASTFRYFDGARRNRKNRDWFTKNLSLYNEHVAEPFAALIGRIDSEFGGELPRIAIANKKVSQPLYRANRIPEDGTVVKPQASVYFSENKTSMFEWNPGIYISIGASDEDNVMGLGLYMISSRQLSLLRDRIVTEHEAFDDVLQSRKLKKMWGELAGETYTRFPKGFSQDQVYSPYLWHKQFYLHRHLNRKMIQSNRFTHDSLEALRAAMPFFKLVRETVGTFQGRGPSRS